MPVQPRIEGGPGGGLSSGVPASDGPFRLGSWLIEPRRNLITRGEKARSVEPRAMDVLVELARRPQEVVSRQDLLDAVWGDQAVVEGVLTRAIYVLRRILEGPDDGDRVIETVPRRGYRLTVAVEPAGAEATAPTPPVLAVLPFENLSGDERDDYLADGITEMLITHLAGIASLRVISRTSSMTFKGATSPLPEIARTLSADLVLEGTVTRAGEEIRVTGQLIEGTTDHHRWAKAFTRPFGEVLALQDEISTAIVDDIRLALTPAERRHLSHAAHVDPAAYQAYLRGRFVWKQRSAQGFGLAIEHFEEAARLDPGFAHPHAGLADTFMMLGLYGMKPPLEVFPTAKRQVEEALRRDPDLVEARTAAAAIDLFYEWRFEEACHALESVVRDFPSYGLARLGLTDALVVLHRLDEALEHIQAASGLDPLDAGMTMNVGDILLWRGRHEEAAAQMEKVLALAPDFPRGLLRLARVEALLGREEEAVAHIEKLLSLAPAPFALAAAAWVHAALSHDDAARDFLGRALAASEKAYLPAVDVAEVQALLGDGEEALTWLDRAIEERSSFVIFSARKPAFDRLRDDPRFLARLEKIGAPPRPV